MATDKKGLTIEVTTYVGPPLEVDGVWTRDSASTRIEVPHDKVTDDPYGPGDATDGVLRSFQEEHACKVAYLEDGSSRDRKFDVFEPTWDDRATAQLVADTLARRLVELTCGAPNHP